MLITSDEARHTIDAGDVYLVMPEHPWWDELGPTAVGKAVDDDFEYASNTNDEMAVDRRSALRSRRRLVDDQLRSKSHQVVRSQPSSSPRYPSRTRLSSYGKSSSNIRP